MNGLEKLKEGDFNYMSQEEQPDGSVLVILSKRVEGKTYRFVVKDLYGKNERVISEEVN